MSASHSQSQRFVGVYVFVNIYSHSILDLSHGYGMQAGMWNK